MFNLNVLLNLFISWSIFLIFLIPLALLIVTFYRVSLQRYFLSSGLIPKHVSEMNSNLFLVSGDPIDYKRRAALRKEFNESYSDDFYRWNCNGVPLEVSSSDLAGLMGVNDYVS